MIETRFRLPNTAKAIVVYFRDGKLQEQLIDTPQTNKGLVDTMFRKHRIGPSEIRAVKAVDFSSLLQTRF